MVGITFPSLAVASHDSEEDMSPDSLFFSLASRSIPWFYGAGWSVHKCSQWVALFLDAGYHFLAAFEESYLPYLATGHA